MKTRSMLICLLACLVALSLAGCWGGQGKIVVNGDDNPADVKLRRGEPWELSLSANPSTGYQWTLSQPPDKSILALETEAYYPDPQAAGRPGANGRQVFSFRARKSGATALELIYARPWEKDQPPLTRLRYTILVH
ncbi:MAG: protease inhibitor I42 family protein [Pseudomonadota bacterium]